MDINELESFKLSDAVKFHKELNPRLWQDNKLDSEVRDQLLLIAEDFVEYLGISNLKVKDVTISGSNAAYSYTPHSDLDLHVLVDFSELPNNEVYQELFTAKKTLYNDAHDITVRNVPVELYVQDTNNPVHSLGEYSIVHDNWIRIPKKRRANFDEAATKAKYEKLGDLIELALKTKDPKRVADTIALVKRYRKSGLDKHGEFGPENLAYKAVRKQGLVQALYDLKAQLHGEKLSIEEEHTLLNKPTLSVPELAEKHGVSRADIATQLDKGIKVELEHTRDRSVAREIALDHIAEDPKYYDKLDRVDLEETTEEHQIVNVVAKIAANKIVKIMQTKRNAFLDVLAGPDDKYKITLFGLKTKDLDVPSVRDPVLQKLFNILNIRVSTYKDWKNDEEVKTHGAYYLGEYLIDLMFPALKFAAELRGTPLEREVASTLSHEIQHALDDLKSKGKALQNPITSDTFKSEYQSYLKKPYEVNARFQQALMDIAEYIPQTKLDGTKTTTKDLPNLIKYAFEKNRLDDIYSKNQPEYKRLLSRAYKFFDAEMRAPKQVKSIPQNIVKRAMSWILGNSTQEINEASGYIPSAKEKNDPRFKTALTTDVKPNSIKKNAEAFNWKTSRAGIPPQARADGKITESVLDERIVDPYALGQRAARRYGKKTKYGSWEKVKRGKHIPLSNYDEVLSDELDSRYYHYLVSLGYRENRDKAMRKLSKVQTTETFNIKDLVPSQPFTRQDDPELVKQKIANTSPTNVSVMKLNGKYVIVDGHHSVMAAMLRGDKTISAKFLDLDKVFPKRDAIAEDLMNEWKSFLAEDQEQQELFPGYDEKHRQERLNAWLGKSQAVTANYKPKVLYHATTKHFDQFRAQNKGFASALGMTFEVDRSGIFLAENPKFAAEYIEDEYGAYKENAVIIPVYLSAQYTFVLTDSGLSPMLNDEALVEEFKEHDIDLRSIYYHIYEDQRWELFDGPEGEEFVANLKKLGYDSAFMYEDSKYLGRNGVWVAFEPSQVKAITNRGSFSPDDPRLMKESGELEYLGNCTEDDVVDDIFGNVSEFARVVEEHGDEFTLGNLVVKYDDDQDIHYFYKNSG